MITPPRPKMFQRFASHVEVRENIRAKRALQLFRSDIEQRFLRMLLGRVVHQDIELAKLIDRERNRIVAKTAGRRRRRPA